MENTSEKIKNNLGSVVKVMNYAIEKEKSSLIELLRKNGAEIKQEISDYNLSRILIAGLKESETFRIEFRNFIIEKSQILKEDKFKQKLASLNLPKFPKKYLNSTGYFSNLPTFDESLFSSTSSETQNIVSATPEPKPKSGLLNTVLDFVQNQGNNLAIVIKSKSDEKVMADLLEIERERNKQGNLDPKTNNNSKTKYIVLGVAAIAIVGLSIWYFKKSKK